MHEAFWNGLSGVRWEEAPLGPEAIRLIQRLRERGYAERTCRDYGHAVVHLGRYLHEELESDRVRDERVVADFLAGHLPGCRCYRRPMGRREEPARRGLAHLLVMLREEGAFPPVTAAERHRLGARRDRHLRAEDRPAPRTAADPPGRGGGAGLPAGRTPPVAAPGSLPVQPSAAWPATEQDQPLAGTPAGQGGHRDRPPRCSCPAPLAGGPPAAQR